MHVDHEEVEYVAVEGQDYEEVIKEYKEEIFIPEEFQEPPVTDTSDFAPTQGKYRCITLIFANLYIYLNVVYLRCRNFHDTHMCVCVYIYIYIYTHESY
jgi:hypothetical protein